MSDCCRNPKIQVFDHWDGYKPGIGERTVNRVCLTCHTHWHGDPENPTRYTKREWDKLMDEAEQGGPPTA